MFIFESNTTNEEFVDISNLFMDTYGEDFTWAFYYSDDLKLYLDELDEPVNNIYQYLEPFELELLKKIKKTAFIKIGDIIIGLFPSKDIYDRVINLIF